MQAIIEYGRTKTLIDEITRENQGKEFNHSGCPKYVLSMVFHPLVRCSIQCAFMQTLILLQRIKITIN